VQTLRDLAPWLALASGALALVALVLAAVLWARLRAVRRGQLVVMGAHDQRDIVAHSEQLASQVRNLRQAVERLTDDLEAQKHRLEETLRHRALVRYDAFRDAGGQQSATLVLLDDYRSGFVLSAIAARDFARVYVKNLDQGVADRELSPEERRAVAEAVPKPLPPRPSFATRPTAETEAPARPAAETEAPARGAVDADGPASPAGDLRAAGATAGARPRRATTAPTAGSAPAAPQTGAEPPESPGEGAPAAERAGAEPPESPPRGPAGEPPTEARRRSPLAVDDDFVWESRAPAPERAPGESDAGKAPGGGGASGRDTAGESDAGEAHDDEHGGGEAGGRRRPA